MNKIIKIYEAVFLCIIYIIIAFYSARAMLDLINSCEDTSTLLKVVLVDTFWLTIILALGALLMSILFNNKRKKR